MHSDLTCGFLVVVKSHAISMLSTPYLTENVAVNLKT